MPNQLLQIRYAFAIAPVLLLGGCAAGPDFRSPAPPKLDRYSAESQPVRTESTGVPESEAQQFLMGHDLPGQWWSLFGSAKLNTLIEQAMANYPDIAAQQAALSEARENVRAQQGVFLPQMQGAGSASRSKQSGAAIAPGFPSFISNVFSANVNVSYSLDAFGGERRALEGLQAKVEAQGFVLLASVLTLTSNIASTVIEIASVREQIAATEEILALEETQLSVVQRRFLLGSQTQSAFLQQQSNLASVRATLAPLEEQLGQAQHQLAVLTGKFPGEVAALNIRLADLTLPQELPLSLPSSLVSQRPDIRGQAAVVHQASAAIGVATANMLPQFTLTGSFGDESSRISSLINPGAAVWSLASGVVQPIFQGGALRAKRRAAIDAYQQATAQYRLVVLQAVGNVADTLTALDSDAKALKAQHEALVAAQSSLDLIQKQYQIGSLDYISLLTAEQSYQQARLAYARALATRFTDTVTLFQALGGSWWNRRDTDLANSEGAHL
jgi:NodT family efflux transporter outer membrane factor (OMF) lipoprotein